MNSPMSRPTLMVVADVLGLSPEVDDVILDTVLAGAVTTADIPSPTRPPSTACP